MLESGVDVAGHAGENVGGAAIAAEAGLQRQQDVMALKIIGESVRCHRFHRLAQAAGERDGSGSRNGLPDGDVDPLGMLEGSFTKGAEAGL